MERAGFGRWPGAGPADCCSAHWAHWDQQDHWDQRQRAAGQPAQTLTSAAVFAANGRMKDLGGNGHRRFHSRSQVTDDGPQI